MELGFAGRTAEAMRRRLVTKAREVGELLKASDHKAQMTPRQYAAWLRELESVVALLWRTDAVRHVRLQPLDEIKMGIYYLDEVLYSAVPELYAELEQLLSACYPQDQLTAPAFLRFGSWIVGDQDGNPNIGPSTLLETLHQ